MKFRELKVNSEILFYGKRFIVLSITPPIVTLRRLSDGEFVEVSFLQLVENAKFKTGNFAIQAETSKISSGESHLALLSNDKREKVSERFNLIKPILDLEKAKNNDINLIYCFKDIYKKYILKTEDIKKMSQQILIERISKLNGKSERTIKRYLASYRKAESEVYNWGEEGLISKSGIGYIQRTDNKTIEICNPNKPEEVLDVISVRIDTEYIPIIKQAIENEYLTLKSISISALYDYIEAICTKKGIVPPNKITIYKIINRLDPRIMTRLRSGKKATEMIDDVERGYTNNEAKYPNHIVAIDHTLLDIDVIDDKSGLVIGRPWITVGIDLFTRMVWCLHVSFEPPSANKVRKALQQGVFFKKVKEKYNTINEWDIFGVPSIIQLDNGPDFKSAEVRRMVNETLRSTLKFRPVRTPRYGAVIERLFGTINSQLIHRLDGTRKSNPVKLGDYKPEEEAKLTLNDITELLTIYITDIYHYTKHKGLPLNANTPIARYYDGLRIVGYPEYVDSNDEDAIRMELLPQKMKPYTRDGVRLNNVCYKSTKLSNLIDKRAVKYKIKYDLDDISKIYIKKSDSSEYEELFAQIPPAEELMGVNLYTYKKILELDKEEGTQKNNAIIGTKQLKRAKMLLQNNMQKMYKASRTIRKQVNRMGAEITFENKQEENVVIKKLSIEELINNAKMRERY